MRCVYLSGLFSKHSCFATEFTAQLGSRQGKGSGRVLTPLEVAAIEPLAAPPLRELWASLTGTLQPDRPGGPPV